MTNMSISRQGYQMRTPGMRYDTQILYMPTRRADLERVLHSATGSGPRYLILSVRRHSLKKSEGDGLTEEGLAYAEKIGAEQLDGHSEEIEGVHSPMVRTRQTLEQMLKGAHRKNVTIRADERLRELPKEYLDYLGPKVKKGRKECFNDIINKKGKMEADTYEISHQQVLSYVTSEIRRQLRHMKYGTTKRVESLTHGPKIDVSLVELLRRNGVDVQSVDDYGGTFSECNHYEIHVKQSADGKVKMTVKYRGKEADVDPKSLGLSEQELKEAIAAMQDGEDGSEGENAEGSEGEGSSESREGQAEAA